MRKQEEKMKKMRKLMALLIATIMMASNISPAFASTPSYDSNIINRDDLQVKVAKPEAGKTAGDLIKNP